MERNSRALAKGGGENSQTASVQQVVKETLRAIEKRSRLYRTLVITVSSILILPSIFAIVSRSATPLLAVGVLIPLAGTYLVIDGMRLTQWRAQILELWRSGELDLVVFAKSISAHPMIPRRTLEGMLASLPVASKARSTTEKDQVIWRLRATVRRDQLRTILATLGLMGMALSLGMVCAFRNPMLLAGFVIAAVMWAAARSL
jgi:hypothetical protein